LDMSARNIRSIGDVLKFNMFVMMKISTEISKDFLAREWPTVGLEAYELFSLHLVFRIEVQRA